MIVDEKTVSPWLPKEPVWSEWREHGGGPWEGPNAVVQVLTREEREAKYFVDLACSASEWTWPHGVTPHANDIVAYRVKVG